MPFNCDVCGEEVSYSEKVFKLRNGAEIVICKNCLEIDNKLDIYKEIQECLEQEDNCVLPDEVSDIIPRVIKYYLKIIGEK